MENKLREDLWKSIQAHYERNDYTEAVRDAIFHTSELSTFLKKIAGVFIWNPFSK